MKEYEAIYKEWCENAYFDEAFSQELKSLTDEAEIEDRFYMDLEFGTAGMRGIIGAGRNRINTYVVQKASQGFANYLLKKFSIRPLSIAIAYDNRRYSDVFALETALVMAGNGIKVYLYDSLRSTPQLSFAVRFLKCQGGVVITASHNPPEYNGYKVYGDDGAQLIPVEGDKVTASVQAVVDFKSVNRVTKEEALQKGLLSYIGVDVDKPYLQAIQKQCLRNDIYKYPIGVVYTPLHGAGGNVIKALLSGLEVMDVHYVKEQMIADPDFSTCKKPNPEDIESFELAQKLGKEVNAQILIATDPDADRVGVMVKVSDKTYQALNGNETGALLVYYILTTKHDYPLNSAIVKTIVTSELGARIARDFGVDVIETLTGFKYIGEKIKQWEKNSKHQFVMGYEESYGYLIGTHARDKDAVVATMLIIEMAKYYAQQRKTLIQVLHEVQEKYGYFKEKLISKGFSGIEGHHKIQAIMDYFRTHPLKELAGLELYASEDYQTQQRRKPSGKTTTITLTQSDVLKFIFEGGSWIALRPSGTEPKIKFYFSVTEATEALTMSRLEQMAQEFETLLKQA